MASGYLENSAWMSHMDHFYGANIVFEAWKRTSPLTATAKKQSSYCRGHRDFAK